MKLTNQTDYCVCCGMPLDYDRFVSKVEGKEVTDGLLCSFCVSKDKNVERNNGKNGWVLEQIVNVYNTQYSIKRLLSKSVITISPILPKNILNLAQVIHSVPRKSPESKFDALVLYSGGKDSSYMLINLAKRKLRVCAWMLNQGYQSPEAISNAKNLCDKLGIPLVIENPDKQKTDSLFKIGFNITKDDDPQIVRSAMTYGSACWPCFSIIAAKASLFCYQNQIPFCFIGTQEGQNRLDLNGQPVLNGRGLPNLQFLVDKFMNDFSEYAKKKDPNAVSLLQRSGYTNTVIVPFYEFIKKPSTERQVEFLQSLGWKMPKNTGACSSNCMINELGRKVMRKQFGFDLYQVINAHERRIGNDAQVSAGKNELEPPLDNNSVKAAAKMIRLNEEEREQFGIESHLTKPVNHHP